MKSGAPGWAATVPSAIIANPALSGSSSVRSCDPPSGNKPTAAPDASRVDTAPYTAAWSTLGATLYPMGAAAGAGAEEEEEEEEEEGGGGMPGGASSHAVSDSTRATGYA
jgi:hypothetical protein